MLSLCNFKRLSAQKRGICAGLRSAIPAKNSRFRQVLALDGHILGTLFSALFFYISAIQPIQDVNSPIIKNEEKTAKYSVISEFIATFAPVISQNDNKHGNRQSSLLARHRQRRPRNKTDAAMDNTRVLTRDEALSLVRDYKRVITPRFSTEPKVYMYGSYSKGYPKPESDIESSLSQSCLKRDTTLPSTMT